MDKFDTAALLDESGIKMWQWRSVQQCLKVFMGINQISVNDDCVAALGNNYGTITHGTYHYIDPKKAPDAAKEEIRFWTKDPVFEFMQCVEGLINGYNLNRMKLTSFM